MSSVINKLKSKLDSKKIVLNWKFNVDSYDYEGIRSFFTSNKLIYKDMGGKYSDGPFSRQMKVYDKKLKNIFYIAPNESDMRLPVKLSFSGPFRKDNTLKSSNIIYVKNYKDLAKVISQ